jgi:hypothetical protein
MRASIERDFLFVTDDKADALVLEQFLFGNSNNKKECEAALSCLLMQLACGEYVDSETRLDIRFLLATFRLGVTSKWSGRPHKSPTSPVEVALRKELAKGGKREAAYQRVADGFGLSLRHIKRVAAKMEG